MRISKKLTLPALVLATMALAGGAFAGGQVGDPAAGFTLDVHGGGSYNFSDDNGKVRVIYFVGYG